MEVQTIFQKTPRILLHTGKCGAAQWLEQNGLSYETLDALYEEAADFDAHIGAALERLEGLEAAQETVFCVLTDGDEAAKAYLRRHPDTRVLGGDVYSALRMRAPGACLQLSAESVGSARLSAASSTLVTEIDTRILASEVKLRLGEVYGWDAEVFWRFENGQVAKVDLEDIDRFKSYDHRSACLINPPHVLPCHDMEGLLELASKINTQGEAPLFDAAAKDLARVALDMEAARRQTDIQPDELFETAADLLKQLKDRTVN